jgi:hypothetical protein
MSEGTELPDPVSRPADGHLRFSLCALAAGVVGAVVIPGYQHGLNWLLTFAAVGAAVVVRRPRTAAHDAVLLGAGSLAFAGTAVLSDAQWVVGVNLVFAAVLAVVAVTGVSSWTQLLRDGFLAMLRVLDGIAFVLRPLSHRLGRLRWQRVGPIARGAGIGGVLVSIFGGLFLTADRAFAQLTHDAVIDVDVDLSLLPARVSVALALIACSGALALTGPRGGAPVPVLLRWLGAGVTTRPAGTRVLRRFDRAEWVTPLILLDLLFAAFVAVQVTVLFGGQRHVLETAGLTYAEYARTGFFQLCAVGAGALAVVAGTAYLVRQRTSLDDLLLRILLGLLLGLTIVILVSALKRLSLYEATYGYTRLRLAVHATILWMAGIVGLVLIAGVKLTGRWVPVAAVGLTATALMTFTLLNPDAMIARNNVERFERTGEIDLEYVSSLSADAAGALNALPQPQRDCVFERLGARLGEESWMSFNLSRHRARAIVDTGSPATCLWTGRSDAETIP